VLSTLDAVVMIVGLVLGAGIFRAPPVVAGGAGSESAFLGLWVLGGVVSLVGALCYAELASTYPHAGGEYHFLSRAFGRRAGFLCAWSRMTVVQTGSIAILAFVVGDYAGPLLAGGPSATASAVIAAGVVVTLTAVNCLGLRLGCRTQYVLTGLEVLGILAVAVAGFAYAAPDPAAAPAPAPATSVSATSLAIVFVLLTFGGWSEAAYLSAEVHDRRRGVSRTLTWGIGLITLIYLLTNAAYVHGLGLAGLAASTAPASDVVLAAAGPWAAAGVSLAIVIAALSSANATMITGARSSYAMGRDVPALGFLGAWGDQRNTPVRALLAQGGVALFLVGAGAAARQGFEAMVAYTAPVFWLILLGSGLALIVLRRRDPAAPRPFRVPLYPLTPILFCLTSAFMLYSSVAYAGRGALLGLAVAFAGLPLLAPRRRVSAEPAALPEAPPAPGGP
jgi:amino acid transporter